MSLLDHIAAEASTAFADFDEPVLWRPQGGQPTEIRGIHDLVSELIDLGEIIEADGSAARLDVATSLIPGIAIGDAIAVRDVTYRVIGTEPDGTGRTIVALGIDREAPVEYGVTIGSSGTLRGYRTVPAFGSIAPTSLLGFNIWGVLADTGNDLCVLEFGADGDTQLPGVTQIGVTFRANEGNPPPETIHTWDAVERYQAVDAALASFYDLNVGQTRFAQFRIVA